MAKIDGSSLFDKWRKDAEKVGIMKVGDYVLAKFVGDIYPVQLFGVLRRTYVFRGNELQVISAEEVMLWKLENA
jgi:hypothetical protein